MSKNIRQIVRNLANERGVDGEIFEELCGIASGTVDAADRGVAIVGAAILEDALRSAITEHLARRKDNTDSDNRLFEGAEAPLGSLAQRTRMAFSLGIIDKKISDDIDDIRSIRIAFAHSPRRHVTFAHPEIRKLLDRLNSIAYLDGNALTELERMASLSTNAAIFSVAIATICGALSLHVPFWMPERSLARALKVASLHTRPPPDPPPGDNPDGPQGSPEPPPRSSPE